MYCRSTSYLVATETNTCRFRAQVLGYLREATSHCEIRSESGTLDRTDHDLCARRDEDAAPHPNLLPVYRNFCRSPSDGDDRGDMEDEAAPYEGDLQSLRSMIVLHEDIGGSEGERIHRSASRDSHSDTASWVILDGCLEASAEHVYRSVAAR